MRSIGQSSLARGLHPETAVHRTTSIVRGGPPAKEPYRRRPVPRTGPSEVGSDRSFGFVMAAFFAIVAVVPLWGGSGVLRWAALVSAAFLGTAVLRPSLLRPLNRVWFRFGALLHRLDSPIVLGLLFFGVITPTAVVMHAMRRDVLGLAFDPSAKSYWIKRPDNQAGSSKTRHF